MMKGARVPGLPWQAAAAAADSLLGREVEWGKPPAAPRLPSPLYAVSVHVVIDTRGSRRGRRSWPVDEYGDRMQEGVMMCMLIEKNLIRGTLKRPLSRPPQHHLLLFFQHCYQSCYYQSCYQCCDQCYYQDYQCFCCLTTYCTYVDWWHARGNRYSVATSRPRGGPGIQPTATGREGGFPPRKQFDWVQVQMTCAVRHVQNAEHRAGCIRLPHRLRLGLRVGTEPGG